MLVLAGPPSAVDAQSTPACGQGLSVLATSTEGIRREVLVSVPAQLSRTPLPAAAFRAEQAGQPTDLFVRALRGPELAVTVVLGSTANTPSARFDLATSAAVDLLSNLPEGSRSSSATTAQDEALSGLSEQPAQATQALRGAERGAGAGTVAAVRRAAAALPVAGQVVLFADAPASEPLGEQQALLRELTDRGVVLSQVNYAAPRPSGGGSEQAAGLVTGTGCRATGSVLAQVDQAVDQIDGLYRLRVDAPPNAEVRLSVAFAGTSSTTVLPKQAATTSGGGDGSAGPSPIEVPDSPRSSALLAGALVLVAALLAAAVLLLRRRRRAVAAQYGPSPEQRAGGYAALLPASRADGRAVPDQRGGPIRPSEDYEDVDVAIVMESTYPYLRGGVSAVVHDIVMGNQDLSFGVIHITWDSQSPSTDLYGMPANVKWVRPVYLSMSDHKQDFSDLRPAALEMTGPERRALADRLFDALEGVLTGNVEPMWLLYDDGMNPRTRTFPLWALLGSKEFMAAARERLPGLGLPLTEMFWLLREFFSLACAVLGGDIPRARVYHAHTTGYASLLGAAAARQNDMSFLLTEHNLYVRDTVNMMLERSMALRLSSGDWRAFDVTALERAWMAWWIEMGHFCYPSAETITYLYPTAISEAADLGAPVERSVVIPNGMTLLQFEQVYQQRLAARARLLTEPDRVWRLVYIARVVPIKGLADLIGTVALLVDRGFTDFHLDILGPTDHHPDYYRLCREKARTLNVEDYLTFRGTVQVRELLGEFDVLVLPSYNEGQPIVVLEAMTAGIPTVGTNVGGMAQLIDDPLTTPGGRTWGPCGLLVDPDYVIGMADSLQALMRDPEMYESFSANARGRVADFFQLEDAMGAYNRLYRELGGLPVDVLEDGRGRPAGADANPEEGGRIIDLTDGARPGAGHNGQAGAAHRP